MNTWPGRNNHPSFHPFRTPPRPPYSLYTRPTVNRITCCKVGKNERLATLNGD